MTGPATPPALSVRAVSAATRRQVVLTGASGALGSALLAACGAGGPSSAKTSAALPAEMQWMGWSMMQEFLVPAYEEAARAFSAKQPTSNSSPPARRPTSPICTGSSTCATSVRPA